MKYHFQMGLQERVRAAIGVGPVEFEGSLYRFPLPEGRATHHPHTDPPLYLGLF